MKKTIFMAGFLAALSLGSSWGWSQGIVEASEKDGIKLSPEAFRNFEIKTLVIKTSGPWTLPSSARVQTGEEVNLYRFRNGFFKRIDFTQLKRDKKHFVAKSEDIQKGDEVVVGGVGFLRVAEISAFGGAPEGHSH